MLVHELREDWRKNSEEVGSGPARTLAPVEQDLGNWFRTRIDIFEIDTGKLLTSTYPPRLLAGFIGPFIAVENRTDDNEWPTIVVWRANANFP